MPSGFLSKVATVPQPEHSKSSLLAEIFSIAQ
jgi:hypothetical protein